MATADDESSEEQFDRNKLAVALRYERGKNNAPVVAAKGKGYLAEQILELAREHGVAIREDADLVTLLSKLDLDTPIPLEAYAAVAEILSYIYRANGKLKRKTTHE